MNITIFGVGYVGLTTGACLANMGHHVLCVDIDQEKVNQLRSNLIPFFEPGLKEFVEENSKKGRLRFTTSSSEAVDFGQIIFNCVGTPSKENGSANLSAVYAVSKTVGELSKKYTILVNKSTVPPGTAKKCQEIINNELVDVVSNPEFLKEGNAIQDFRCPNKIVIGSPSQKARNLLKEAYSGLVRPYVHLFETTWETAEMIKYANNSFLATKISFINEIANICDLVGADVKEIAGAMGVDYRISPKFLNAGLGYAGSCFPKDVRALSYLAQEKGYIARLLVEVDQLNSRQKKVMISKLKSKVKDFTNITFSIWGLSFKPKTSDVREAISLVVIEELLKLGAKIKVYDPVANEEIRRLIGDRVIYCSSVLESVKDSSAIVLITEWDEFRNVDFKEIGSVMKEKLLVDGRNIYDPSKIKAEGFTYVGIGR